MKNNNNIPVVVKFITGVNILFACVIFISCIYGMSHFASLRDLLETGILIFIGIAFLQVAFLTYKLKASAIQGNRGIALLGFLFLIPISDILVPFSAKYNPVLQYCVLGFILLLAVYSVWIIIYFALARTRKKFIN